MAIAISSSGEAVTLRQVKDRLNKTGVLVDDHEIKEMLEAAFDLYEQLIGPIGGVHSEKIDGGGTSIKLSKPAESLVAVLYSDGTTVSVDDLDLEPGTSIVHWNWNTAGRFTAGSRNVIVTYNVKQPPKYHREVIRSAVANYFIRTQRPSVGLPGEGGDAGFAPLDPESLFPGIVALQPPRIA